MNKIVVGLGFGDEGKGTVTDWLCSQSENPIVVRFNGGQQAGHTVMFNGKKHVHSNYGSGTLRGIPSYFTEHCSIYLNTMAVELKSLQEKGIEPELYVHPLAKVTTPYDVAWNRATELKNGHGSCGLGIAATMKRHNETPYKLFAADLSCLKIFHAKLKNIANWYESRLTDELKAEYMDYIHRNYAVFLGNAEENLFKIMDYSKLEEYNDLVWEGAQGILLDMDHGIFPNVTYSHTTSRNAIELIEKLRLGGRIETFYVTRCYTTRHGAGWMPEFAAPLNLVNNEEEINVHNDWQKSFRVTHLDYELLNYALEVESAYNLYPGNVVVTCLDQRPDFKFDYNKLILKDCGKFESRSPYSENIKEVQNEMVDI